MNRRDALRAVAGDLLVKLGGMRDEAERYGDTNAQKGTADHDRVMLAYEELSYRLERIIYPWAKRKAKPEPSDPHQVALFE